MEASATEALARALTPWQLADRLIRLQQLTAALSAASNVADVTEAVLSTGVPELGAAEGWVCLLDPSGEWFDVVAAAGAIGITTERWRRFPRDAPLPAGDALRSGDLVIWESVAERDRRYPTLRGSPMAHEAYIVAPMVVDRVEIGAVVFGFADARRIDEAHRVFVSAAVQQTAQAVRRAQLHEQEQRAHRWQRFLAEAGVLLARSLRYEDVLREIAELAVPTLADGCLVHLLDTDGLRPVAATHATERRREHLARLVDRQPVVRNPYLLKVAETGESLLLPVVTGEVIDQFAEDDEHRRLLSELGIASGIVVALLARGRTVGTLTLITTETDEPLGEPQLAIAEALASRAALAIDNARAYEQRSEVARVLQQALLPPSLPDIPGVQLAARYRPAADLVVGGDYYDVIERGGEDWSVLVGDVCGKDATAASLTALARHTARAPLLRDHSPAQVLEAMNEAFAQREADEHFCTAVCARLRLSPGGVRLETVIAGHPPPVIVGADGSARPLEPSGQPVGMFEGLDLRAQETHLAPGDAVVIYTDGVTEARRDNELFGTDRVLASLREQGPAGADALADGLLEAVTAFQGGEPRDDLVILALSVDG